TRAVEQRHVSLRQRLAKPGHRLGIAIQFLAIAPGELFPPRRIVAEPLAQLRRGRDGLQPVVQRGGIALDPARPETIDQHPPPIRAAHGLINAFEVKRAARHLPGSRLPQPGGSLAGKDWIEASSTSSKGSPAAISVWARLMTSAASAAKIEALSPLSAEA